MQVSTYSFKSCLVFFFFFFQLTYHVSYAASHSVSSSSSSSSNLPASNSAKEKPIIYSFGIVPQFEQRKSFRIWQPILKELEKRTGYIFVLKGSTKIPVFENSFMAGEFDFAYMNPYHLAISSRGQGYIPLVRDGLSNLQGVLVVRRDSGIRDVSELSGKLIAFPSPNALGASLLVRAELKNKLHLHFTPKYVQTHSSVYYHVFKNRVDAGGGVIQTLESQDILLKNQLKILFKTRKISPHPIAVHPRVPVAHQARVEKALLDLASEEEGKRLLEKIPMRNVISASIADYQNILKWDLEKFYIP